MSTLKEAFEYASQNPNSEFARSLAELAGSGSLNVEAKKYNIDLTPFQPKPVEPEEETGLQGVGVGIAKGALDTFKGASQLGTKIGNAILPKSLELSDIYSEEALNAGVEKGEFLGKLLNEENLEARGVAENVGKTGEQIAEFFVPAGVATKAKTAIDAVKTTSKLVSATKLAGKAAVGGVELGGVSALQSGEFGTEAGISAGIGSISPILGAGIKALKPTVAPVLEFTSGVPKEAIKKAMTGTDAVKLGMNMTTEQVRSKAVQAYKGLDSELKSGFSKGLDELSKLSPRIKPARTSSSINGTKVFRGVQGGEKEFMSSSKGYFNDLNAFSVAFDKKIAKSYGDDVLEGYLSPKARVKDVGLYDDFEKLKKEGWDAVKFTNKDDELELLVFNKDIIKKGTPGVFSGVKGEFKKIIEGAKESVPQAFRDLRISVKGNKLDFDKLNSSIVNASERKQIQQVWDTIRNQTDFSVKGVQDVAARIIALSKFEKGIESVSSVAIGKMHSVYSKAIEKVYPELGKLRSNYSTASRMLNEIDDIVESGAKDPTKVQTAINKLTNLFKEDKNTYLKVIDELSKKSGVDVSGMLAGTEFTRVMPGFIRGVGGAGILTASATFLNPLLALLFPLFSPKLVGKTVSNAPKIGKVAEATKKVITGAVSQISQ